MGSNIKKSMLKNGLVKTKDALLNLITKNQLIYITPVTDWSIKWDGLQITQALNKQKLIRSAIRATPRGIKNTIIHFGSGDQISLLPKSHRSNKTILTWFHVIPNDPKTKNIINLNNLAAVHTSCQLTKKALINLGINESKITVIPLGINLNIFQSYSDKEKIKLKNKLGLPNNKIIIGSFQKDGIGWKDGLEPKLEKGPDIFCDIVSELTKKYDIHVLLTGPARGYVKNKLKKYKIPYTHHFLKNYLEIVNYYNVLDFYLITSRIEGGPKALLECWATGTPVISSKVGMIPDISTHNANILQASDENIDQFVKSTEELINDNPLKNQLIANGLNEARKYSWEKIAAQYYEKLYSNIL